MLLNFQMVFAVMPISANTAIAKTLTEVLQMGDYSVCSSPRKRYAEMAATVVASNE